MKFHKSKYSTTYINLGTNFGEKRNYKDLHFKNRYIKFYMGFNTGIDI